MGKWEKNKKLVSFDKYCLVDLDEIHNELWNREEEYSELSTRTEGYQMKLLGMGNCESKMKKGSMRLCSLKGTPGQDVRLSYSSKVYVPKACMHRTQSDDPDLKGVDILTAAVSLSECKIIANSRKTRVNLRLQPVQPLKMKTLKIIPSSRTGQMRWLPALRSQSDACLAVAPFFSSLFCHLLWHLVLVHQGYKYAPSRCEVQGPVRESATAGEVETTCSKKR